MKPLDSIKNACGLFEAGLRALNDAANMWEIAQRAPDGAQTMEEARDMRAEMFALRKATRRLHTRFTRVLAQERTRLAQRQEREQKNREIKMRAAAYRANVFPDA